MAYIAVPLPNLPGKHDIEIDVTINGQKQQLHYRVEPLYWEDCGVPSFDRADCIRHLLNDYDQDWAWYYIGTPPKEFVPITFGKKSDCFLQNGQ